MREEEKLEKSGENSSEETRIRDEIEKRKQEICEIRSSIETTKTEVKNKTKRFLKFLLEFSFLFINFVKISKRELEISELEKIHSNKSVKKLVINSN